MDGDAVTEFYDDFLRRRMVSYRVDGNPRLDAAIALARRHARDGMRIGDIGCGVGIVADRLALDNPASQVLAVDLSPANIAYAERTAAAPNVAFFAASVTEQFDALRARAPADRWICC